MDRYVVIQNSIDNHFSNRALLLAPSAMDRHGMVSSDAVVHGDSSLTNFAVYVYRLLGGGSLEELVYARQLYKQQQMAIGYDASAQTR